MTRHELREENLDDDPETDPTADGSRLATLGYTVDVVDVVERYLFTPVLPVIHAVVQTARRLQSGRLDAYMAYMLIALLAVITVLATS